MSHNGWPWWSIEAIFHHHAQPSEWTAPEVSEILCAEEAHLELNAPVISQNPPTDMPASPSIEAATEFFVSSSCWK